MTIKRVTTRLLYATALVVGVAWLGGCAMTEPLATDPLQQELKNPQASVVIIRFIAPHHGSFNLFGPNYYGRWVFAAGNEATGWNLRELDRYHMVFHTRDDSAEPDIHNSDSGWVTFIVPPGTTYIAAAPPDYLKDTAFKNSDMTGLDFIDMPRFVLEVEQPRSLIYAGTIVAASDCEKSDDNPVCSNDLAIQDDTALAQALVARYRKWFKLEAPLQTRLLAVPPNRTITIPRTPAPLH